MGAGPKLFGTDGIRAVANSHPVTPEFAVALGRSLVLALAAGRTPISSVRNVVIGRDTRESGLALQTAFAAGVRSMGATVSLVGCLPTPAIAYLTKTSAADAGVVITASHNPYQYNGFKIFDRNGFKISEKLEQLIESKVGDHFIETEAKFGIDTVNVRHAGSSVNSYLRYLKGILKRSYSLSSMHVVFDGANGAASQVGPELLEFLGAKVTAIHCEPNGVNINESCGAVNPKTVCQEVQSSWADIGISLDGDGDRVVLSDENGEEVDGDQLLAICGLQMLSSRSLRKNTIVTTVMSNLGLDRLIESAGGHVYQTGVGDKLISEAMVQNGFNLGEEPSGHIIFGDYGPTGDGLVSTLKVIEVMLETGKPLSELKRQLVLFPQINKNIRFDSENKVLDSPKLKSKIKLIEKSLGKRGRLIVRKSGTEPLIRVSLQGECEEEIDKIASYLVGEIQGVLDRN